MSVPVEEFHQRSLDILAKLASLHKYEDVKGILRETNGLIANNNNATMCSLCEQINCVGNCSKENMLIMNMDKENIPENISKTPKKCISVPDPVTPTANLKMLVSAASDLAPAVPKEDKDTVVYDADSEYADDVVNQKLKVKKAELMGRKEKSLGLLCKKFMSIYPEFSPLGTTVMLDDVVTSLGIGRRRVYDIVNVLESMEMMVRQAKNKYIWFGKSRLPETLAKLKALSLRVYGKHFCLMLNGAGKVNAGQKAKDAAKKMCYILPKGDSSQPGMQHGVPSGSRDIDPLLSDNNDTIYDNISDNNNVDDNDDHDNMHEQLEANTQQKPKVNDFSHLMMDSIISYDLGRRDGNRSLGILCQKFIMLFMVAEENTVSLDRAAKLLITDPEEGPGKYKTKVRRLYDIANILTSINFLEKCPSYEESTKKAAYKWIGLDLHSINCEEDASRAFLSQEFSLTRHSLLTQAPRECYKLLHKGDKSQQRKFRARSSSAHTLSTNKQSNTDVGKQMCSFHLRTLSDTMVGSENMDIVKEDGFNIENMEEEENVCENTKVRKDSPNQMLFKEKLRNLQKEFPDKLPSDGLLNMLSLCKDNNVAANPSRRRLSSVFDSKAGSPCRKKVKPEHTEPANYSEENATQVSVCKPAVNRSLPLSAITNTGTNRLGNNGISQNFQATSQNLNIGNLQQQTYFTIPATLKPILNSADSFTPIQNISTMLVSPLSNPISLPQTGLYQIIPVQCHTVERIDHPTLPSGHGTLLAKPTMKSTSENFTMSEKQILPMLLHPPATDTSPSISPIPSSLKAFTDSPINYHQLSENYQDFFTPPHILSHNFIKPPANPIMFPKMTLETPTSDGLSHSVLKCVTRKLSLQKEDNV